MDWKFVLALVFALLVAVFALQNAGAVDISFLTMELSISQALVILISAAFGALVVFLLSLVRWIKCQGKIKSSAKAIHALEQENKNLKMKLEVNTVNKEQTPKPAAQQDLPAQQ
ncbi:MAG: LapA family protein [Eubacteriales bacterium]|nr:LapA family protein [Eubacteriales bacterium]